MSFAAYQNMNSFWKHEGMNETEDELDLDGSLPCDRKWILTTVYTSFVSPDLTKSTLLRREFRIHFLRYFLCQREHALREKRTMSNG